MTRAMTSGPIPSHHVVYAVQMGPLRLCALKGINYECQTPRAFAEVIRHSRCRDTQRLAVDNGPSCQERINAAPSIFHQHHIGWVLRSS
jgi:hypothetical protein